MRRNTLSPRRIRRLLALIVVLVSVAFASFYGDWEAGRAGKSTHSDGKREEGGAEKSTHSVEGEYFQVTRVVDGDTIRVTGLGAIRYIGIDTPERGEPFFEEAKRMNAELVGGKEVRLVICSREPRDRYGRILAWVYVDGVFVNGEILSEGLAKTLIIPPCGLEKAGLLKGIEKEAKRKGLGVWGARDASEAAPG